MAIPYPYTTKSPLGINTGSYLNQSEYNMFVNGFVGDIWYGFSERDVVEVSAFDLDLNPLGWAIINTEKEYKKVTLSYLNSLDQKVEYSYAELLGDFILYRNSKILVNPIEQLSQSFGILQGSYILTYNFTREMAGQPTEPLVVKEISPSRKEVKLTPVRGNNARYEAFCKKKFQIKDVAPVLIQATNQCPIAQIYNKVRPAYTSQINFLKQLLFLESDGAFVNFLKTLYDDVVVYKNNSTSEKTKRTQGIRTYYQNFLLSNYENISDFIEIDNAFDSITTFRVEQHFRVYGNQTGAEWVAAKQFLIDFFTTEFYHQITVSVKSAFDDKYFSFLKNSLNLGDNKQYLILDHAFMDERTLDTDPLTLVLKLKEALPEEATIQTECWISNISIAPFVARVILRQKTGAVTQRIGAPNFSVETDAISLYNVNESYTAADLRNTTANQDSIDISKKISELQVDYTDFSKFVIFSSAAQRLSNFKRKISTWYALSASIVTLDSTASASLAAGTLYPQYDMERGSLTEQMTQVVTTFDGYESYLFQSGSYAYNPYTKVFVSASFVREQDQDATAYDKSNRDSLINNTPEHILLDSENDEYLTFLNMVGHYFDNLYLYIANLPSEKVVQNDPTKTLTKKMIDFMLKSFGWKLGTAYEDETTLNTYLTDSSTMSAEDRSKAIRTRILSTLPQIYKTKGTEEAVKLLLACHGIPSNLLDIREYGNNDYNTGSIVTYTKQERSCMFSVPAFIRDYFGEPTVPYIAYSQRFGVKPSIRTFEIKLAIENPELYPLRERIQFASKEDHYDVRWDYNWTNHTYFPTSIACYEILGSYYSLQLPSWRIGFVRETEGMGRIWAELPSYSASLYVLGPNGTYSGSYLGSAVGTNANIVGTNVQFGSNVYGGVISGSILGVTQNSNGTIVAPVSIAVGYFGGTFNGYMAAVNASGANGNVSSYAKFTSSYFSGSINGGSNVEISGGVLADTISGRVTGSLVNVEYLGSFIGTLTGSSGFFAGTMSGSVSGSITMYSPSVIVGQITGSSGSFAGTINGTLDGNLQSMTATMSIDGELTGARWEYIDQPFNRVSDTYATTRPNEQISYARSRLFLSSSLLPIFDGEIFNVRLRRNDSNPFYQFTLDTQKVPASYDLTVQRNQSGRQIFRSFDSKIGQWEENAIWDGISIQEAWEVTGSLGTTTTASITIGNTDFVHPANYSFGNAMVWDVPISDSDFEIHCNDYSSFAYSGSHGEKHLITRMDADEPYDFASGSKAYEQIYHYPETDISYSYGAAVGRISNKSEYYSTFDDVYSGVVASGSWTGGKTGSLRVNENFTGSMSGSVYASVSGSGNGTFANSKLTGWFSGSITGSVNGVASGYYNSYQHTYKEVIHGNPFRGKVECEDSAVGRISASIFTGNFSGSASGSFTGTTYGYMSSSQFGYFFGQRVDPWSGIFTGSVTGSVRAQSMTGSFWGQASGSLITVDSIGTGTGDVNQFFFGVLSGSLTGSWSGSAVVSWSGSTSFNGTLPAGAAIFSGSMKGTVSSSVTSGSACDFDWRDASYGMGLFSGSFIQPWTGSKATLYGKPVMVEYISYDNEPYYPLHASQSNYYEYCDFEQKTYIGVYPYEFVVKDLEKTYTTPNFGPNRFRNEKVKAKFQTVEARLDDKDRSTHDFVSGVQSDSNLLGLYIDPQDAKNRDIVKYCGGKNIVDLIADPLDMFSSSYLHLKELNETYNSYGDRRVLYNELISLYKIYFNRSIFETIKNIAPARASVRTGVVVEPTVLERPKYQHKKIVSEANSGSVPFFDVTASHYAGDYITKLVRFSGSVGNSSRGKPELLYAEFNVDTTQPMTYFNSATLPSNLNTAIDVSYINEVNFNYPTNYGGGYITDMMDEIQFGNFGSTGNILGYREATGVTTQDDLNLHPHASGSARFFLVKKWDKYTIFSKSGSHVRTSKRSEDCYSTSSIWLYSLVAMSPLGYSNLFYTSSKLEASASVKNLTLQSDVVINGPITYYKHHPNTAINTPNKKSNNIRATVDKDSYPFAVAGAPFTDIAETTYFEVFSGYPRNHYTHKRMEFSPVRYPAVTTKHGMVGTLWIRGRQTEETTVALGSGLSDGSPPVQEIKTSNVNLVQSDNVINQ